MRRGLAALVVVALAPWAGADSCFCLLEGALADCPCTAATIDTFNSALQPLLEPLLASTYFRYFQVDFDRACGRWPEGEMVCGSPGCSVEVCGEGEVPAVAREQGEYRGEAGPMVWLLEYLPLLQPYYTTLHPYYTSLLTSLHSSYTSLHLLLHSWGLVASTPCTDAPLDTSIPAAHQPILNSFCALDPMEEGASCQWVDLASNQERYTGYAGRAATRVWETIYNDLCFHPEREGKSFEVTRETVKEMCFEKRAFYRVVSGLHASIAVHLTSRYPQGEGSWGRNLEEFLRRFQPSTTAGEGPARLANLYFLYLLELRALALAAPALRQVQEGGGALGELLARVEAFPHHLDESSLFGEGEGEELLQGYRENFKKISQLMNCLGCERCKVWGKLQVTGIGTALKVLTTPPALLALTRHEVVALVNAFGRVSTSIKELGEFRRVHGHMEQGA